MASIVLPIEKNPLISTYANIANFFSLLSLSPYQNEWIFSNLMLPLYVVEDSTGPQYRFTDALYRDCCLMDHEEYFGYMNLSFGEKIQFIKRKLENHYYVVVRSDEMYIPNSVGYRNCSYPHRQMVYGIDTKKQELYVMMHNNRRKYVAQTITFQDFERASSALKGEQPPYRLIRINGNSYSLRWMNVACDFQVYLEEKVEIVDGKTVYYGIAASEQLRNSLRLMEKGQIPRDIRLFSTLRDHKLVVQKKLYLLQEQRVELDPEMFAPVLAQAELCQNLFLRYIVTRDEMNLTKIEKYMLEIEKMEKKLYPIFVKSIEKYILDNHMIL